jgi:hypothetical protein
LIIAALTNPTALQLPFMSKASRRQKAFRPFVTVVMVAMLLVSCGQRAHSLKDTASVSCQLVYATFTVEKGNVLQTDPRSPIRIKVMEIDSAKRAALLEITNTKEARSEAGWLREGHFF